MKQTLGMKKKLRASMIFQTKGTCDDAGQDKIEHWQLSQLGLYRNVKA